MHSAHLMSRRPTPRISHVYIAQLCEVRRASTDRRRLQLAILSGVPPRPLRGVVLYSKPGLSKFIRWYSKLRWGFRIVDREHQPYPRSHRIGPTNIRTTWLRSLCTTKLLFTLSNTMAFFYPYYEILTIIGMILLLMATPFHLNMKGTSTWPFILWSFIWCLLRTVNGIVWHDRMDNIAPIWCDICGSLLSTPQKELS